MRLFLKKNTGLRAGPAVDGSSASIRQTSKLRCALIAGVCLAAGGAPAGVRMQPGHMRSLAAVSTFLSGKTTIIREELVETHASRSLTISRLVWST